MYDRNDVVERMRKSTAEVIVMYMFVHSCFHSSEFFGARHLLTYGPSLSAPRVPLTIFLGLVGQQQIQHPRNALLQLCSLSENTISSKVSEHMVFADVAPLAPAVQSKLLRIQSSSLVAKLLCRWHLGARLNMNPSFNPSPLMVEAASAVVTQLGGAGSFSTVRYVVLLSPSLLFLLSTPQRHIWSVLCPSFVRSKFAVETRSPGLELSMKGVCIHSACAWNFFERTSCSVSIQPLRTE